MNSLVALLVVLHGVITLIMGLIPAPNAAKPVPGEFWPKFIGLKVFAKQVSMNTQKVMAMVASVVIGLVLIVAGTKLGSDPLSTETAGWVVIGAVSSLGFLLAFFDKKMVLGMVVDVGLIAYVLVPGVLERFV